MERADRLLSGLVEDLKRFRAALHYAAIRASGKNLSMDERKRLLASFILETRRQLRESTIWATYRALQPLRDIRHQYLRSQIGHLITPLRMAAARGREIPLAAVPAYIRREAAGMIFLIDSIEKFEGSKDLEKSAAA